MAAYKIPLYRPSLDGNEKKYVDECLSSTWISSKGRFIPEFERKFAKYIGVKHAASVCNGTVALHIALLALDIGPGDEVIVPTFTYIAPVNAIRYVGATPVFADSLRGTWQIDPLSVKRLITKKTKAIIVVHLYGHPCDMDAIMELRDKYGLALIEDCAEAFGALYKRKHVGTFGDISTFSFFGNKTITTGEGGMVVSNNKKLIDNAIHLKGQGLMQGREYWHDVIGYNYRMTNICGAIGLAQLERADEIIGKKRKIAGFYKKHLSGTPVDFHDETPGIKHSFWMCSILAKSNSQRDLIRDHLKNKSIETRPTFFPVHSMPMYSGYKADCAVANDICLRGINLPSYPELSRKEIEYICSAIKESL
jgi:perosamine synthetase